eukprot:TRINITY_DN5266_c0_g1_i4.p1 TRINITY_DN5266_c0_g1~~TRINITY_DN5266_c0_g1_i4.p1  ORF type:complete len:273 (-),score=100.84 TRINITY_DN5266_c0_g1_i4:61-879(-)
MHREQYRKKLDAEAKKKELKEKISKLDKGNGTKELTGEASDDEQNPEERGNVKEKRKEKTHFDKEMKEELRRKRKEIKGTGKELKFKIEDNPELAGLRTVKDPKTGAMAIEFEELSSSGSDSDSSSIHSTDSEAYANDEQKKLRDKQKEEYNKLRIELLEFKREKIGTQKEKERQNQEQLDEKRLMSNVELKRHKYITGQKTKMHEDEVLAKLNQFRQKLNSTQLKDDDENWMNNRLRFHIDSAKAYSHFENKEKMDDIRRDEEKALSLIHI